MDKKVLVYFNEASLAPKGGPAAVCYYYSVEQKKRGEKSFDFLPPNEQGISRNANKTWYNSIMEDLHSLGSMIKLAYVKPNTLPYDFSRYDLIHFHSTDALYQARTSLNGFKGKIILQSHSPEPRGREMFAALPNWIRTLFPFLRKAIERMDKYAFEHADYIIFPCPEAEEPYYHIWPYFKTLHNLKTEAFKYVLTGIPEARAKRGRDEVLSEMNIPNDAFVVSYVGRHNKIKGYDVLKIIGERYLDTDENVWFLCAGKEAPLKRLEHPRWKEVGWTTEPHSYIGASDVFVLPNRETYFDIIMIELLSLGKIVIASNTGGNKWFKKNQCPGIFLYDSIEEAVSLINKVKLLSKEERERLEEGNHTFYKEHLTVSCMYDSYIQLLKNILGQEDA